MAAARSAWAASAAATSRRRRPSRRRTRRPGPQDGRCATGGAPAPGAIRSCTVWTGNYVHDNNNANVPASGTAGEGPVGTGMVNSGGRYDTIVKNKVVRNGAWGILIIPFPD